MKDSTKIILGGIIGFLGGAIVVLAILFQRIVFAQAYPRYILLASSAIIMGISVPNIVKGIKERNEGN